MGYDGDKKREYQLAWMKKRREKYMADMGPCIFCGETDGLEIHHIDPDKKESHRIWSWSHKRICDELKNCVAICPHCHRVFHGILRRRPIVHGTCFAYRRGCRCSRCRAAKARYDRKNKPRRFLQDQRGFW